MVSASLVFIVGIIPARAGFTHVTAATAAPRRDHPRSRGVYGSTVLPADELAGSSPLARGLRAEVAAATGVPGIIPARAGFT